MEAKAPKGLEREGSQAATKLMQAAVLNKDRELSLKSWKWKKKCGEGGGGVVGMGG